ncbi:MAG: LCP family protein [Lachnospiraceae bacterium]|nr:LCP family protein [Lachnospiraceae bacterium]
MADKKKKITRKAQLLRRRRKRQVLLLVVEMLLLFVLGVGCFVVSKLDMIQTEKLDLDQIYRPSYENRPQIAEAETQQETKEEPQKETEAATKGEVETQGEKIEIKETEPEQVVVAEPEPQEELPVDYGNAIGHYWNILLVGVDNSGDGQQSLTSKVNSDTLIICSINTQTSEVKLVSVYRDTYLRMPDIIGGYNKANYALMHGTILDTMNVINMNLDMYVTDYVSVNWSSVARCVDLLGGIEVDLTEDLIDLNKGAFNSYVTNIVETTGMGSTQIWDPGIHHLDGVQTVAYCRVRYGSTDFARTERQREVLTKLLAQVKTVDFGTMLGLIDELLPNIATSIELKDLMELARHVFSYQITDATGFPFEKKSDSRVGNISIPDPVVAVSLTENVKKLHEFLYGSNGYMPSSVVNDINYYIGQVSGCY